MEEKESQANSYELARQADRLLRENKLDIWGRDVSAQKDEREQDFLQRRFEQNMQKGAYRSNSESGRRR